MPVPSLSGRRVLVIATHGFEQSELEVPRDRLRAAGAAVDVATPDGQAIRGWQEKDWGRSVPADRAIPDVEVADYDALVLPGGQINPDVLRIDPTAMALIEGFLKADKPVAAICHAPWLLVQADAVRGLRVTSYKSIRRDLENAGGRWEDSAVVEDANLITSRSPKDLNAFVGRLEQRLQA